MAQLTQIKDLQRKRKARQKRKNFLALLLAAAAAALVLYAGASEDFQEFVQPPALSHKIVQQHPVTAEYHAAVEVIVGQLQIRPAAQADHRGPGAVEYSQASVAQGLEGDNILAHKLHREPVPLLMGASAQHRRL